MPELPEVEIFARYFARHALGQKIVRVEVRDDDFAELSRRRWLAGAQNLDDHLLGIEP